MLPHISSVFITILISSYSSIAHGQQVTKQNFYKSVEGKIVSSSSETPRVSHSNSITECATECHSTKLCVAADFDVQTNNCRLFENFTSYEEGQETDTAILSLGSCPFGNEEPGVSEGPFGSLTGSGDVISDRHYFLTHGCITGIRSWKNIPPTEHHLSGLQFRYGAVWAPVIGYSGSENEFKEVLLEPGEYIATVEYRSGHVFDVVVFYTQTGRQLGSHGTEGLSVTTLSSRGLMYVEAKRVNFQLCQVFFHFHETM